MLPVAPLALALVALTACTEPAAEPHPSPTTTPVFETEEQALAAGAAAYQAYLDVWNTIVLEGGAEAGRIDKVTTGDLRAFENESLTSLGELGWTFSGEVTLDTFQVGEWYTVPDAAGVLIVATACVDLTGSGAVDANGVSVVKPDRPRTRTWDVHVSKGGRDQLPFVLSAQDVRKEGSTCGE